MAELARDSAQQAYGPMVTFPHFQERIRLEAYINNLSRQQRIELLKEFAEAYLTGPDRTCTELLRDIMGTETFGWLTVDRRLTYRWTKDSLSMGVYEPARIGAKHFSWQGNILWETTGGTEDLAYWQQYLAPATDWIPVEAGLTNCVKHRSDQST